MTALRIKPFGDFYNIKNHFDELVKSNFLGDVNSDVEIFSPKFDIYKDDKNVFIDLEVPGMKKEDVSISLQENVLTIEGEKNNVEERKSDNFVYRSRNFGKFSKEFKLTEEIDQENIDASFENGLLKIKLNMIEKKEIKKVIDIK